MSVKKNFLYNTIYQIFIILLPIITVPYVSRVLQPEGVGIFSYTAAYSQYFVLFGMIGIPLYGNRQIAYTKVSDNDLSEEFFSIYSLQLITTIISFFVYIIFFVIINKNNKLIYLVQSINILAAMFDISWFFIGYEEMKSIVIRNSLVKIVGIICIFIFVKNPSDIVLYTFIIVASNFLGQIIMWFNLPQEIVFKGFRFKSGFSHLKPSIILFISQIAIQIYTLLDKTMLGIMTNTFYVGLYENSQKTIKLVLTLVTSLGVVMMPRMSALFSENRTNDLKKMIDKAFKFVNFMAFPMVFGLIAIANSFSQWFYGNGFNGVGILLKFGAILIIAIAWSNILGIQIMLPMKKEKEFNISVIVGAIVNVILNIFLINKLQALGTTISSVIAEFAVTGVQIYFLRDFIDLKKILKSSIQPLIASLIMLLVLELIISTLEVSVLNTVIEIIIGCIVYFIIMYFFKNEFLVEIFKIMKFKIRKE